MYGKMQKSGLTEIIPLTCTSAIWGQYLVFSHPESPQGASLGVAAAVDCLMVGILFLAWVPAGLTVMDNCNVMAWWLQPPLFTDMTGNIFFVDIFIAEVCKAPWNKRVKWLKPTPGQTNCDPGHEGKDIP